MERPTTKGNYTKQDLVTYANYRKNRESDDNKKLLAIEDSEKREADENYRNPLAISKAIVLNIELSTGGDADGYKITLDTDGEVAHGVYYWADWGVYEEVPLDTYELCDVVDLYLHGEPSIFLEEK